MFQHHALSSNALTCALQSSPDMGAPRAPRGGTEALPRHAHGHVAGGSGTCEHVG